jgi:hypothetical protein
MQIQQNLNKMWLLQQQSTLGFFAFFLAKPQLSTLGESMMKYTFCDPCQEKCKVAIN